MAQFSTTQNQDVDLVSVIDVKVEQPNARLRWILVIGDAIAAAAACALPSLLPGSLLAWHLMNPSVAGWFFAIALIVIASGVVVFTIGTERLYKSRVATMRTVEMARLGRVSLVAGLGALVVGRFIGEPHLARITILTGAAMFVFLNVFRVGYTTWLNNSRRNNRHTRSVVLVGANDEAFQLFKHMKRHPELGYRVRGIVGRLDQAVAHDYGVPWLGDINQLPMVLDETGLRGALVVGGAFNRTQLNQSIRQMLERKVHIHLSTGINGIDHRRMQTHSLAYEPMVYLEQAHLARWQTMVKRAIDIVVASIVLIVTSPILAITALLVRRDGGPALFRQDRVGQDGQLFSMTKFRSMEVNAEDKLIDLAADNVRQGPLFKLAVDPRVTRIGKIIRASSIDELPQLFNVLKGDMSLVGPRPALPSEVAEFDEVLLARQNVMPGITGLWQVEGRDNPDFTLYQRLDIYYVENWSVALDLTILLATAKVVIIRGWSALSRKKPEKATAADATVLG